MWTFFDKEDRLAKLQKSDFQSHFSTSIIVQIFTKIKFIEEYQLRTTTFDKKLFFDRFNFKNNLLLKLG